MAERIDTPSRRGLARRTDAELGNLSCYFGFSISNNCINSLLRIFSVSNSLSSD